MGIIYDFSSKVAVVTGSAGGIGKAIAEKFYSYGAYVVISDIETCAGEAIALQLGERAIFIPCDISKYEQVVNLLEKTLEKFGRLDVMVNNAGINSTNLSDRITIDKYPNQTWNNIINVDLNGTFYCCKEAARIMITQGSGSIINIASVAGVVALRLQIGFVAAKAAIVKMTEAMSCELAPKGVRVNSVSPGSIITESTNSLFYSEEGSFSNKAKEMVSFIPQGRPGQAGEIADAVLFLSSDSASYINGHNLVVDGGWICGFNRDF